MTKTDWHASDEELRRFALDPRNLDDMVASSIEAHVVACETCREELSVAVGPDRLRRSWAAVADRIDRPRLTITERLLPRRGLAATMARLVAATPSLQAAGLVAVCAVAFGAAALSRASGGSGPFLVFAPLAPLLAVAGSFAPAAEPAGEAGIATPVHGVTLVVWRALAALLVSMAVLAGATILLPHLGASALAWVLPSFALSSAVLAAGTWFRTEVALGGLAGAWIITVGAFRWAAGLEVPTNEAAVFSPAGQVTALVAAAAAIALAVARRDCFATMEVRR